MPDRVRVNVATPHELLRLPGVGPEQAERIVKFRDEHGPIGNESELSRVLGWRGLGEPRRGRDEISATERRRPTSHAAPRFGAPRDDRDAPASTSVKKTG